MCTMPTARCHGWWLTIMNNWSSVFPYNFFLQFPQKLITNLGDGHTYECHQGGDWCRKENEKGSYGVRIPQPSMLDAASAPLSLKCSLTSIHSLLKGHLLYLSPAISELTPELESGSLCLILGSVFDCCVPLSKLLNLSVLQRSFWKV